MLTGPTMGGKLNTASSGGWTWALAQAGGCHAQRELTAGVAPVPGDIASAGWLPRRSRPFMPPPGAHEQRAHPPGDGSEAIMWRGAGVSLQGVFPRRLRFCSPGLGSRAALRPCLFFFDHYGRAIAGRLKGWYFSQPRPVLPVDSWRASATGAMS
ncbi:MAG: hypothetical protein IPN53_22945 [Comamonadaceae bacterium]|nr:hypothetical protein [Comamonadaceae bacterium]